MMLLQCNLNFRQGTHIKSKARAFEVKKLHMIHQEQGKNKGAGSQVKFPFAKLVQNCSSYQAEFPGSCFMFSSCIAHC